MRQRCSQPAQQSAQQSTHAAPPANLLPLRGDVSGASAPRLPAAARSGPNLTRSFASYAPHSRQLHTAGCASRGFVTHPTAAAGGRQLTLLLRQQRQSSTAQLAGGMINYPTGSGWGHAAARHAWKRLQVGLRSLARCASSQG